MLSPLEMCPPRAWAAEVPGGTGQQEITECSQRPALELVSSSSPVLIISCYFPPLHHAPVVRSPGGLPGLLRKGKCKVSCRQAALIYGALQPCQTPNLLSEGGKASSPVENVLLVLGRREGQELEKEVPLPVRPLPCPHLAVPQFLLLATGRHSFLLDRLQGGGARHTAGA